MSLLKNGNKRNPPSLRTRYIALTLLLGLLVISIVLFFYSDAVSTKRQVTDELVGLNAKLNKLDGVRSNLNEIYRNIDLFLLDPTQGNHAEVVHHLISDSIIYTRQLNEEFQSERSGLASTASALGEQHSALRISVADLIDSRMDVNRQYPGLALSANEMSSPQQGVSNSFLILIAEIENGDFEPKSVELYPMLLKTRSLWLSQISQMRIYLANRFASFSNEILVTQAESLDDLHLTFLNNVDTLEALYANEDSFEGPDIVAMIANESSEWINIFQQVRKISESGKWRSDSHIMKSNLIPLTDDISASILSIENLLQTQEQSVAERLRKNTETLSTLLFTIVLLFLLYISAILFSLEWMVFRPISSVAMALRSKAFNIESPELVVSKSREIDYLVEAFHQMDEQVNQRENALEHQALHDHLTGLPNRFMLNQRLEYQLLTSERNQKTFTLFLMDLDHFKDVNDSLGHATGDMLLIEVANRLATQVRKTDTVARLGGDEFAILLPDTGRDESELLAKSIFESITAPFSIGEQTINVGVSIGIVSYPVDGNDVMSLLQHADIAMYIAKRNRTSFSHYDASEDHHSLNRLGLINDLRKALTNDSLELNFQPQVDVDGTTITGAEALLRWNHPLHGFIQPDKIVELAEYVGIIHQLSFWVLDNAIAQCSQWHQQGISISIAVNLSVQDLANPSLCDQIGQLLDRHQLPSEQLTLEITESGMMENPARSIEVLKVLSSMGINLSIDDFGTGFSSLAYLKQLPVNELKIDKSFVLDMDSDESDAVIVQSTINLGHNLGLRVIAEGVEHAGLLKMVRSFGCDQAQGYLFGKPQDSVQFTDWLTRSAQHEAVLSQKVGTNNH
ncbi:hypothetical protein BOW53_13640 [Solemya pervernicosa gill symbiont]|uniref:GGDEF-domain containing protein n=2 Tax=Gammaproteobacteria incertae sedis TaxID=118884 RepID=A0A1T2L1E9_9GAMM|nr:EAL domain-containing protein [Candidatus Reidiella endopervernicosa]OOZ38943.1 hypothetical protein BOW53_13640 [Solemya pervernicosa gill symbiont]QKQ26823.1 EAL domain-containing protein [Candidatus Reidiella endopervernicosa]